MSPFAWLAAIHIAVAPSPLPDEGEGFHWSGPQDGCPSAQEVAQRVAQLTVERRASIRTDAEVSTTADGFELQLHLTAGTSHSRRSLVASDCTTLLEVALLTYTLALTQDSSAPQILETSPTADDLASRTPTPAPQPSGEPSPGQAQPDGSPDELDPLDELLRDDASLEASPRQPTTSPPPRKIYAAARVHLAAGQGPLGAPSVPIGGSLVLGASGWKTMLGARVFLPRTVLVDGESQSGGELSAWEVHARGCGVVSLAVRWKLPLCAEVAGGRIRAVGFGLEDARQANTASLSSSFLLQVEWRALSWLRPYAGLAGGVSLVRGAFAVDGRNETVFRAPRALVGVEAGVELRFGARPQI